MCKSLDLRPITIHYHREERRERERETETWRGEREKECKKDLIENGYVICTISYAIEININIQNRYFQAQSS
jgi:hypothetical protein